MWVGIAPTTVSDLVLPRMRGVAGAYYILMVSMLGLALGPYSIGYISDYFFSLGYSDAVSLKYALAWGQSALLITIDCTYRCLLLSAERRANKIG